MCIRDSFFYREAFDLVVAGSFQFLEQVVDVEASPGIGSGILLLSVAQYVRVPVGQPLWFGNLFFEQDCINLLQTFVPVSYTHLLRSVSDKAAPLCWGCSLSEAGFRAWLYSFGAVRILSLIHISVVKFTYADIFVHGQCLHRLCKHELEVAAYIENCNKKST